MSFQRVDPFVPVPDPVRLWAKAAGPATSPTAAAILLGGLKSVLVYALMVAVGIGAVLLDDLLGFRGT